MLPEHRRAGVGTLAEVLLCDYLFSTTAVNRIEAFTNVANTGERRALTGAGLTEEGVIRQAEFRSGSWQDLVMNSRLRSEWTPPSEVT